MHILALHCFKTGYPNCLILNQKIVILKKQYKNLPDKKK
jgi:hypothetical protein